MWERMERKRERARLVLFAPYPCARAEPSRAEPSPGRGRAGRTVGLVHSFQKESPAGPYFTHQTSSSNILKEERGWGRAQRFLPSPRPAPPQPSQLHVTALYLFFYENSRKAIKTPTEH